MLTNEQMTSIFSSQREGMSYDQAQEVLLDIINLMEAEAAKSPEEKAAVEGWSVYDRLLWIVKEAYCMGTANGVNIASEVMQEE